MKAARVLVILAAAVAPASAQLRVVTYNSLDAPSSTTDENFNSIFGAIAASSVNGIALRPNVIAVQEQTSASTSNLAHLLNTLFGVDTYVASQPGGQTATDRLGFVYDSAAVNLLSPVAVVASGGTRPHLRAEFRPVGYSSEQATFYVYNSHLNASSGTIRMTETASLRSDAQQLPPGSNVITTGDYNVRASTEAAYQNLVAGDANALLFDPIDAAGTWRDNPEFAHVHTQSTRVAQFGGGTGGGMDDRFDFQLASGSLLDGDGLSYIGPTAPGTAPVHSYRAFGNGGNTFNGNVNDAQNISQSRNTLDALYAASDHLPVVADYQLPARMDVAVAGVPARVIVGAELNVRTTVTNSAPVVAAAGADRLHYTLAGTGAVTGTVSGVATATADGNMHDLPIDTTTPGEHSGSIGVNSTSVAAEDANFSATVTTTVLAHSNASFDPQLDRDALTIDFGIRARGSDSALSEFLIHNLADPSGFTAALRMRLVTGSGDLDRLSADVAEFDNLSAGGSANFSTSLDTATIGSLASEYVLTVADEDLPGAIDGDPLTLRLLARVAIPGDATLDDFVNLADFNVLAANFGMSDRDWTSGDFTGDRLVNLADFNLLASNFGLSAVAEVGPEEWSALAAVVPEPALMLSLSSAATLFLTRLPRRQRKQPPAG